MILKYIIQCFKIIFNLLFSLVSIERFRFIYNKKTRGFSLNKFIKLLKWKQNCNFNLCFFPPQS